jgi:endonuclease YncB( thermonuclease family)
VEERKNEEENIQSITGAANRKRKDIALSRIAVVFLFWLVPAFAIAGIQMGTEVRGFVVDVSSDCMLIVSIDNEAEIVRLAGIAYPEDARRDLRDAVKFVSLRVLDKKVRIECLGRDPLGNILGRIYIDHSCLNDAVIQAGLALPRPSVTAMPRVPPGKISAQHQ